MTNKKNMSKLNISNTFNISKKSNISGKWLR